MKIYPTSFKSIPNWVIEQFLEEVKFLDFLPNRRDVRIWLATVGIIASSDTAAKILTTIKPQWEAAKKQQAAQEQKEEYLEVNKETYEAYQKWKKEKRFLNDAQAIEQLLGEYFSRANDLPETEISLSAPTPTQEEEYIVTCSTQEIPISLNQSGLAKRLNVSEMVLSRNRNSRNFTGWSSLKDPENLGWQWIPERKIYQVVLKQKTSPD